MSRNLSDAAAAAIAALHALHASGAAGSEALAEIVSRSGLVAEDWYLQTYPDVAQDATTAARHYAVYGYREGRVPSPELADIVPQLQTGGTDAPGNDQSNDQSTGQSNDQGLEKYLKRLLARLLLALERQDTGRGELVRQGSYEALYDLPLYVHWSITSMCNYSCSYCSFRHGEDKHVDRKLLTPFAKLTTAVGNLAAMNRPLYEVVLLGGEPTVDGRLPELLRYMESRLEGRLRNVTIVTNGSRDPAWFNQLAGMATRVPILITVSIHTEQAQPKHIYSLIRELDPALNIDFVLMLHPEKLELVSEIHAALCKLRAERPFEVNMQPIFAPPDFMRADPRYPDDFFAWRNDMQARLLEASARFAPVSEKKTSAFRTFWEADDMGRSVICPGGDRSLMYQRGWLNYSGMHCVCGTNLARIDEEGWLFGAVCGHAATQINMYEPDAIRDSGFMRMVTCPLPNCTCNDNDINMKFRDRAEAEQYLAIAKKKQERLLRR